MKYPYLYLWTVSVISLILAFLNNSPESTLDINIHDTYYVILYKHLYILLAVLYLVIGLPYLLPVLLKKKLLAWLTHIHVWGSILFFFYLLLLIYSFTCTSSPQRYYTNTALDSVSDGLILISSLAIFVLIQPLALANIIIAMLKKP